jgi:hypothetical protein
VKLPAGLSFVADITAADRMIRVASYGHDPVAVDLNLYATASRTVAAIALVN